MSRKGRNQTPPQRMPQRRTDAAAARGAHASVVALVAAIIVVAVIVYAVHRPALTATALHFDDGQYLTQNMLVQRPSWASARRFLTEVVRPSTVGGYYQPLAMISLMLDWAQGGRVENLRAFHRTSLLLHVANTTLVIVLLYLLLGRMAPGMERTAQDLPSSGQDTEDGAPLPSETPGRTLVAAMVGLLFGLHPLTVEPIPWTGERKTVLAAFFALWCLIFYVSYAMRKSRMLYAASLAAYVLALMSKPTSTPLPVAMLLLDYWPLGRLSRRAVLEKLPFFAIGGVSAVITFASQALTAAVEMPGTHDWSRIPLILCHNIVFYLYKIVWPTNLSSHYAFPDPLDLSNSMVLAGVIGTCILIPALLLSLRRTRALLTGWLIFFVIILPTMQIVGFSNVIASDKFIYLSSVGLLLIVAWALIRLWSASSAGLPTGGAKVVTVLLVAGLAASEGVATRRYLYCWQDGERLYKHMLGFTPNVPSLHASLGAALVKNGKPDEAVEHYAAALRIDPGFDGAHINLALVLLNRGKPAEALAHLKQALKGAPQDFTVHNNMGLALAAQEKYQEAVLEYEKAAELNPDSEKIHRNMADALVQCGRLADAVREYEAVLRLKPDSPEAHCKLGDALGELGRSNEAVVHYRAALRITPLHSQAHCNLSAELAIQGKYEESAQEAREALRLRPGFAKAHYNLAVALAKQEHVEQAIAEFREAIRLEPGLAEAHNNLGAVLAGQDKLDEAVGHLTEALHLKPNYVDARCNLAYVLERQGKLDEAIEQYHEAVRLDPKNTAVRKLLDAALDRQAAATPK